MRVIGPRDPRVPNAINTTSKGNGWTTNLSPFHLGPCDLYKGLSAKRMENGWQFCKVYKEHADHDGNPTQAYWDWAQAGWADSFAHRYPAGKGRKPLYSLWDGQKLDYVTARKTIYLPLYARAVIRTTGFAQLKALYQTGQPICLFDFDGYDHIKAGLTLTEVLNNPNRIMGHAFILAMLLENHPSVQEYTS